MSISIVGFSTDNKVPGFFAETVYNAGPVSVGDIPLVLLLVGTMLSSGTSVANQNVDTVLATTDADTFYGAGSELAVQCYGALNIPGVQIRAAPVPEAGGAAAATVTITITGSWTQGGTYNFRVDGVPISVTALSTDTIHSFATSIAAGVNAVAHCSASAVVGAGSAFVVTLTRKSKGARGNQGILYQDTSQLPTGMSIAIAGGASITGPGVHFGSGSGADSVSTLINTVLQQGIYDRVAVAQNDATNGVLWKSWLNTQAGPLVGLLSHMVMASNDTLANATSIAQTSLNAERIQYLWQLNGETIPSQVSATFAAYRTFVEQTDPDAAYDGYILPNVAPQVQKSDWPSMPTLISALDNSLTPVSTDNTGNAIVIRSITTHSLDVNGNPSYLTLDTSDAVVPDYVRKTLGLYWTTSFKVVNPKVGPDPAPTQRSAPAGMATPLLWNRNVTNILNGIEDALIITDVSDNLPVSEFNATAKRIMSIVPVVPAANNHQIGVSVRGVGAA